MEQTDITRVGVVGAGTMGAGIAEVFAEAGYEVLWYNRLDMAAPCHSPAS